MRNRKALITGITGQDGSYLAELLLEKGYEVHGLVRRVALEDPEHKLFRIRHILDRIQLHTCSIESYSSVHNAMAEIVPDECYHLAAQSYVSYSFDDEYSALNININGTHHVLGALRSLAPGCRFYFAGSSEMFGRVTAIPQNETTCFHPRSAYGISKVAGYELTRNYRETYGIFGCTGFLFNHESPRRGYEFVTRKISMGVASIVAGRSQKLVLGNLDAKRDWGHAKEYVEAMWRMLQQSEPKDYVVATGEANSVRYFVEQAFAVVDLDYRDYVVTDAQLFRPSEINLLVGDASKARDDLGWEPKIKLPDIIREMVLSDSGRIN